MEPRFAGPQQLMKIPQRCQRDLRRTNLDAGAIHRVELPGRQNRHRARDQLDMQELTRCPSLTLDATCTAPIQRTNDSGQRHPARHGQNGRAIGVGRRNWTFCGSDAGGERAAVIFTLIETAKLCDVDPRAWLADVLARIADHPASRIDELLPWTWRAAHAQPQAA